MTSERLINESFRKLERAYARQKKLREESALLGGIGSFLERVNGAEHAIGDVFTLGHKDAREPKNKNLRRDWAKLFLEAGKLYDAKNAETSDADLLSVAFDGTGEWADAMPWLPQILVDEDKKSLLYLFSFIFIGLFVFKNVFILAVTYFINRFTLNNQARFQQSRLW